MFYSDRPINSNKEDQLGRSNFAKLLAKAIYNLNNKDTFTIALSGKWGSGKTSLVNMMLKELEENQKDINDNNKIIIIRFEPWNFYDANQLLSQFFIRLSSELRSKGDTNLAKVGDAVEKYAEAFDLAEMIPYVGKPLALIGKNCTKILGKRMKKGFDESDILKQKEFVINLLIKQNKRILIVIDDIDRLSNEQIRQVFQLIASVAKFPNMIYLLVFDKDIVIKALEKVQEGEGEDYLKKIIQMPIQIPDIPKEKLRQVFFNRLTSILNEFKDISFQQSRWQRLYMMCIDPFINNLRDINRLCNSIKFKLISIYSEIDFTDIVIISAIEIFLPQIYEWIKNNKSFLTGEFNVELLLWNRKSQKEMYDFYYSEIKTLLHQKNKEKIKTDKDKKDDIETVITCLSHLFPYFGQKIGRAYEVNDLNMFRKNNLIAHPEKFNRYFDLDLNNVGLRKAEINKAVYSLNQDELKNYLLDQDKKGISYEFLEEINAMRSEIPSERAKIIIDVLLETSTELDVITNKMIFSVSSSFYAKHMIIDLLDIIDPSERLSFLINKINNANIAILQTIATIINTIELGYGRLAANGIERAYKKVITLDELIKLEEIFILRLKAILNEYNLFDFRDWKMVCYLLENFDSDFASEYLSNALNEEKNIARYLEDSVVAWTGNDVEYEITENYKKYLTEDRIFHAINNLVESGDLFMLPEETQYKCVAFYIKVSGNYKYSKYIPKSDVIKLLKNIEEKRVVNCKIKLNT